MIISRTPFRISFFGGGTDYPTWYKSHGGAVLATSIDKYCYLTCRYLPPFFEHKTRVVYSRIESCSSVDDIKHPSVREVIKHLGVKRGVEIHHDGDLPARSGMGSSSSFTVGLLNGLNALLGNMPTKHDLAGKAIYIEQNILKETVGSQDQIMAAYGGLNHVSFMPSEEILVRPVTIGRQRMEEFQSHLMLFYTCIKRTASNVADSYVPNLGDKKRQLRVLRDLVEEALSILTTDQDIHLFGELLNESWYLKQSLSEKVSNDKVNELYQAACSAGALGGKLTGAGGGGFMLLFIPPEKQERVRSVLKGTIHVPFKFDFSGSQIIYFNHETDYQHEEQMRDWQKPISFKELVPKEATGWN